MAAEPTPPDDRITEAEAPSLLTLVGSSGAISGALGLLFASQAAATLMANATAAQQRGQTLADAVTAAGAKLLEHPPEPATRRTK